MKNKTYFRKLNLIKNDWNFQTKMNTANVKSTVMRISGTCAMVRSGHQLRISSSLRNASSGSHNHQEEGSPLEWLHQTSSSRHGHCGSPGLVEQWREAGWTTALCLATLCPGSSALAWARQSLGLEMLRLKERKINNYLPWNTVLQGTVGHFKRYWMGINGSFSVLLSD